jgi:hypothetical protein
VNNAKKVSDLFAAARDGGAPTDADRARVRNEIAAKLATAAVAGLALNEAAGVAAKTTASKVGLLAKIALAALLSGTALVAVTTHLQHAGAQGRHDEPIVVTAPSSSAPASPPPAPLAVAEPTVSNPARAPVAPLQPVEHPRPVAASPASVPEPVTVPSASPSAAPSAIALQEEVSLLRRGKSDLERGDAAGALSAVAEYDRRFPRGVLGEEARVLHVLSLCASGRQAEGRALAVHLQGSVAGERMRAACGM